MNRPHSMVFLNVPRDRILPAIQACQCRWLDRGWVTNITAVQLPDTTWECVVSFVQACTHIDGEAMYDPITRDEIEQQFAPD